MRVQGTRDRQALHHHCQLLTPVLISKPMGYIQEVEQGLRVLLVNTRPDDQEAIVRFVKEKVLESYRNGQEAAGHGRTEQKPGVVSTATVRVPRKFTRRQ